MLFPAGHTKIKSPITKFFVTELFVSFKNKLRNDMPAGAPRPRPRGARTGSVLFSDMLFGNLRDNGEFHNLSTESHEDKNHKDNCFNDVEKAVYAVCEF